MFKTDHLIVGVHFTFMATADLPKRFLGIRMFEGHSGLDTGSDTSVLSIKQVCGMLIQLQDNDPPYILLIS